MVEIAVSIIIPMYKVREYIAKCCDSLFTQSLKAVEYIFVSDSTPDDSVAIVEEKINQYPDVKSSVKVVEHHQNMGVAEARNTGLRNATGKYIAFVDADDWIDENMFSELYATASVTDLDVVGCDWYLEYPETTRILRQPNYCSADDGFRAMLRGELRWYLWAFMIKRELILRNGLEFLRGYNIGEDMAFLLKVFSVAKSYAHIPRPLYHHSLFNENSLTRTNSLQQFEIVRHNVDDALLFISSKCQGNHDLELACYKLTVKFPLLISSDRASYKLWNQFYNDSHWAIGKNYSQSLRNKLLQWAASYKMYCILNVYNLLFKAINRILYR